MAPLPLRLRPPVRLGRDPSPPLRLLCTVKPLARDLRRGIAAGPAHRLFPPLPLHLLHEDRVELIASRRRHAQNLKFTGLTQNLGQL